MLNLKVFLVVAVRPMIIQPVLLFVLKIHNLKQLLGWLSEHLFPGHKVLLFEWPPDLQLNTTIQEKKPLIPLRPFQSSLCDTFGQNVELCHTIYLNCKHFSREDHSFLFKCLNTCSTAAQIIFVHLKLRLSKLKYWSDAPREPIHRCTLHLL